MFLNRSCLSVVMLALVLGAYSCSNSPPAGDASANPDAAPDAGAAASSADQVGSVPEDMLADEKGVEPSAEAAAAAQPDPFGDLKEKADDGKAAEATAVNDDATSSPAKDATGSGKIETYTVKAGDTLMKVAFHLYGDLDRWKDLRELNRENLKQGNSLTKGMKLRYEASTVAFEPEQLAHSYEIKKGDTLANIADEVYGRKAKFKKLQGYNKHLIKNPNRIFAGFTIYYDITEKEIAEAEAHRAQRQAGGGGGEPAAAPAPVAAKKEETAASTPSALNPPAETKAEKKVATNPSASDNSAVSGPEAGSGPASESAGPPSPKSK